MVGRNSAPRSALPVLVPLQPELAQPRALCHSRLDEETPMRKLFWIVAAVLVVGGAPVAQADSFAVIFTCTSGCTTPPTAPDVTFPSPILTVTFKGLTFDFPARPSGELPGDSYAWSQVISSCGVPGSGLICAEIDITDLTQDATLGSFVQNPPPNFGSAAGDLTFSKVSAPEPSSLALISLGLGAILMLRKRMGHNCPSVV